jgi:membrane associated rhomboid family serine protease
MSSILDDLRTAFRRRDNALMQLILINVIVFLGLMVLHVTAQLSGLERYTLLLINQFELPADVSKFIWRPWTLLTYAFWHGGVLHILFNMLALYWFGQILTEYLGSKRLVSVYILSALFGGFLFILLYNFAPIAQWQNAVHNTVLLGASGAVYGVVVAAATIAPNYTLFLFLFGPVQIKYIAAIYVILSYIGLGGWNAGGNIAHLGGALIGYLYIIQLKKGTDIGEWIHVVLDGIKGIFKPKPKMKVSHSVKSKVTTQAGYQQKAKNNTNATSDTPNQAEIDAILDKISATGYESLSKEEKQKLFHASKNQS